MSRGDILQMRGRDGMSTLQNGAGAYSVSRICQGGLPLPSPQFSSSECHSPTVVRPNCRGFPLTSLFFSQQPVSDADSTCPACETLPVYSYLVAAPW